MGHNIWAGGFTGSFESRIRVALLGILLAALMLQISTVYWLYRVQNDVEEELYQPMQDAMVQLQREQIAGPMPDRRVLRQRVGHQLNQRLILSDTMYHAVALIWDRIPPSAKIRLHQGETVRIERNSDSQYEIAFARIVETEGVKQVLIVERSLPRYGSLLQLKRWGSLVYVIGLSLLLVAVFLVTRELTKPFRELQRVAAVAQDRLGLTGPPSEDQWDEVIETFNATINELKQKEARLEERFHLSEEERIRLDQLNSQIVDAIPSALLAVDEHGIISQFNVSSHSLPGLPVPETGVSLNEHFNPWSPMAEILSRMTEYKDRVLEGEFDVRVRGERHHFFYQITPVPNGGSLLLLDDRTRLRRLEAILSQRARLAALGETAAGFAHELRNALGAIIGYARLVEKASATETSDAANRIKIEASEMEEMLKRFLEVARPANLQPTLEIGEDLVDDVLDRFSDRMKSAGISLTRSYAPRGEVMMDVFWVRQALGNLLENVLHLVPEGGRVFVATLHAADAWKITISDSGPGIAPEWREKILSPFVSLRPGGTGLGLALVQKVMTAHDGQVEVSESEEGGASFTLVFPRNRSVVPHKEILVSSPD